VTSEPCQFLEWDSEFFEHRIARVSGSRLDAKTLEAIYAWCKARHIECLYFLADINDPGTARLAQEHDFRLVEVRLNLEGRLDKWNLDTRPRVNEDIHVRPAQSSDLTRLKEIARNSYERSRYYHDPCFSREKCQAFYEVWVQNSLEGYVDMVLVAEAKGRILGFITGRLLDEPGEGEYVLTAVDQRQREHGIGQELFASGLDWFVRSGVRHVIVATQARNIPSQRLIQRYGFLSRSAQLYYHKWFIDC
jgi:RimJ/RimL family protein N-acetyltransferase